MKKLMLLTLLVISLALTAYGQTENRITSPTEGYSIALLETAPGDKAQQHLIMFLPALDNFSANVGVQIQPYTNGMNEYVKLSLDQFKSMELKVLREKHDSKTAIMEYSGTMQDHLLHFYAHAEKAGDHIYLVTATQTDAHWNETADQLKKCVDSFRCTGK